jgi:hypothetical protein
LSGALNGLAKLVCDKVASRREEAMVEKILTTGRNVVDLTSYRQERKAVALAALRPSLCRHCGAALGDGEVEEECSGAGFNLAPRLREGPRRFMAE